MIVSSRRAPVEMIDGFTPQSLQTFSTYARAFLGNCAYFFTPIVVCCHPGMVMYWGVAYSRTVRTAGISV